MKKSLFILLGLFISAQASNFVVCKTEKAMATYVDLIQEENLVGVLQLFENDCKKLDSSIKITEKFDTHRNIIEIQVMENKAYQNYWILNNNSDKKEVIIPEKSKSSLDIEKYIELHV